MVMKLNLGIFSTQHSKVGSVVNYVVFHKNDPNFDHILLFR